MSLEFSILLLRVGIIALLYLFLIQAVLIIRRDLRVATGRPYTYLATLRVVESGASNLSKGDSLGLRGVNSLGRSLANSLPILDEFVSGEHLLLSYADGTWYLEDLGSTNGTYLNGRRVEGKAAIAYGDIIQVGSTRLRLERGELG
jgi:pSer/pThr/pTyr-binding forkhead associated (FHA) protein